jgi:hypothetical protein
MILVISSPFASSLVAPLDFSVSRLVWKPFSSIFVVTRGNIMMTDLALCGTRRHLLYFESQLILANFSHSANQDPPRSCQDGGCELASRFGWSAIHCPADRRP